jgi:MFS family permease
MGSNIYGVFFYCFAVSAVLGYLIQFYVIDTLGYQALFWILGGLSVLALLILKIVFKEERLWDLRKPLEEPQVN